MNIIKLFHDISLEKKASIVFVLATVMTSGLNMLVTPFFTRLMPVSDFGVVQLYNAWYQVLFVLATFSVTNAIINVGFRNHANDRLGFLSSSLGFATCTTLFTAFCTIVGLSWFIEISSLSVSLIVLMILSFLFLNATQLWLNLHRYELKYKKVFVIVVFSGVFSTILSLAAVYYINHAYAEIRLWSMNIIPLIIGLFFYVYIIIKGKKFYNRQYWTFILSFNAPLLLHYLSQFILASSDRFMINYYCGKRDVAIYSLGYLISNILLLFFTPLNTVIIPRTHKLLDSGNLKAIESLLYNILLASGLIIIIASLLSPEIVWILGGDEYKAGVDIVPIVSSSTLFVIIYLYVANIEFLYGKTYRIAIFTVVAALSNIVLNMLLIPKLGFTAAAYTTLASYIIYTVLHLLNLEKLSKRTIFSFKNLFFTTTSFVAICAITPLIFEYRYIRYSIILVLLTTIPLITKKLNIININNK